MGNVVDEKDAESIRLDYVVLVHNLAAHRR
jgi:hypothetical protein